MIQSRIYHVQATLDACLILKAEFIMSRQPWTLVSFSQQNLSCPGNPGCLSPSHSRIYHVQGFLDAHLVLTARFITSRHPWTLISFSQLDLPCSCLHLDHSSANQDARTKLASLPNIAMGRGIHLMIDKSCYKCLREGSMGCAVTK